MYNLVSNNRDFRDGAMPAVLKNKAISLAQANFSQAKAFSFELAVINYEYAVCCSRIASVLKEGADDGDIQLKPLIIDAMQMAATLRYVYEEVIYVPREILKLKREQDWYARYLSCEQLNIDDTHQQIPCLTAIDTEINQNTNTWNFARLLLVRSRNFLLQLRLLFEVNSTYNQWVSLANDQSAPFFLNLTWIFFLPRFCINIYTIIKDTLPGGWLHEKERALSWQARCYLSWNQRWFQMLRDPNQIISALINSLVLTGHLAPFSAVTTVVVQIYDVTTGAYRLYQELQAIDELLNRYQVQMDNTNDTSEKSGFEDKIRHLHVMRQYTVNRLSLDVYMDAALLIAALLTVPGLGLPFFVPVIGALASVAITLISKAYAMYLEKNKPSVDVSSLSRMSLFAEPKTYESFKKDDLETDLTSSIRQTPA